jgi:type VI secretion system secreted protein VgrG
MPPYDLPDNMTQSGFKSRSTKKGNPNTFNELRFEDKKGSEEVYVHAQRNHTRIVKNDDFLKVGTEKTDKGDQTIEIENSRSVTLHEGDDNLKVEKADQNIDVKKKINIKAGDQLTITVGQASLVMKKNGDITIKGKTIKFDASMEIKGKAGKSVDLKAAMVKVNGSGTVEIKGGGQTKVEGSGMLDLKGGGMAKLKGGVTMIG